MATHRRKPNRPSIKSDVKSLPVIDWSNSSRNHGTLVKIEKAIQEEKESDKIIQNGIDVYFRIIDDDEYTDEWFETMKKENN